MRGRMMGGMGLGGYMGPAPPFRMPMVFQYFMGGEQVHRQGMGPFPFGSPFSF